ncbi:MAG: hypothetical protein K5653_00650 [Clostridiales bacterium]|nr:hypothetical protein [Clostridiales bacterium]
MTDKEIRKELMRYANLIFDIDYRDAHLVKRDFDKFCKDNDVSAEQLREFTESGAGEMLYMMTHYV